MKGGEEEEKKKLFAKGSELFSNNLTYYNIKEDPSLIVIILQNIWYWHFPFLQGKGIDQMGKILFWVLYNSVFFLLITLNCQILELWKKIHCH